MSIQEDWVREYEGRGALWLHDDNPRRPHACLSSGRHSSGFFNAERVLEVPALQDRAAYELVELVVSHGLQIGQVDRVVGPAMGAITLAHDIARHVDYLRDGECRFSYAESIETASGKRMIFRRAPVRSGEFVLSCEDVITTGGSVGLVNEAVEACGGTSLPYILALVNRSGQSHLDGRRIVALIDRPMPTWEADECPLCAQGSEAIRPKEDGNWERLNAPY